VTQILEPLIDVDRKKADAFLTKRAKLRERGKDATSTLGGETSAFLEAHGLNKAGLAIFVRLNEMSPEKRGDVLRTLDGLRALYQDTWDQQAELALDASAEDGKSEAPAQDSKVLELAAERARRTQEELDEFDRAAPRAH
jgi:hypothetical protein